MCDTQLSLKSVSLPSIAEQKIKNETERGKIKLLSSAVCVFYHIVHEQKTDNKTVISFVLITDFLVIAGRLLSANVGLAIYRFV